MCILGHSFNEYAEIVRQFHGNEAPGVIIGGIMVDRAVRSLPDNILYDAVCETNTCLPDAVQILTPCTIGNGWLKIAYTGRFAMTLYDKQSGEGVRVFLDAKKVEAWPEIKTWYYKLKPKKNRTGKNLTGRYRKRATAF
jgi:formylmethanofuran dehydrogenase subunit E